MAGVQWTVTVDLSSRLFYSNFIYLSVTNGAKLSIQTGQFFWVQDPSYFHLYLVQTAYLFQFQSATLKLSLRWQQRVPEVTRCCRSCWQAVRFEQINLKTFLVSSIARQVNYENYF